MLDRLLAGTEGGATPTVPCEDMEAEEEVGQDNELAIF